MKDKTCILFCIVIFELIIHQDRKKMFRNKTDEFTAQWKNRQGEQKRVKPWEREAAENICERTVTETRRTSHNKENDSGSRGRTDRAKLSWGGDRSAGAVCAWRLLVRRPRGASSALSGVHVWEGLQVAGGHVPDLSSVCEYAFTSRDVEESGAFSM